MLRGVPAARAASLAACAVAFLHPACVRDKERLPDNDGASIPAFAFHADRRAPNYGAVDVTPLDAVALERLDHAQPTIEEWQQILAVYTGEQVPSPGSALPLLGRYSVRGDTLRFAPRFPPVPGQPYIARYNRSVLERRSDEVIRHAMLDTVLMVPREPAGSTTYVEQVYPTGNRVPMNLLRMYVHFSAPMRTAESSRQVRLLDHQGKEVEDAFLIVAQQELWDPERRRLTLLFDPGRIKRDLRPHQELGLPLLEGGTYRLVIDSAWLDAKGSPLGRRFEKRFTVGPPDRTLPQPEDWRMSAPSAHARDALRLEFPEPFDRALLERLLVVKSADGRAINGVVEIDDGERRWSFMPDAPWQPGSYVVEVGTELEDLAGNNLRDLFDVDRKVAQQPGVSGDRARLAFVIVR